MKKTKLLDNIYLYSSTRHTNNMTSNKLLKEKKVDISRIPLPILSRPSKSVQVKFKFYKKNQSLTSDLKSNNKSYTQASKDNISEIIKIKKAFSKLFSKKVSEYIVLSIIQVSKIN